MASLRRIPGSKNWIACFTDATGARAQRSTKTADRRNAQKAAEAMERAAREARRGRLFATQARAILNDLLRQVGQSPMEEESAKAFFERWLKGKELRKSDGTMLRYAHSVRLFLDCIGERAERSLEFITPRDIERFRDRELGKGKAQSTVSVDLKTIRTAFNFARRHGIIGNNPVDAIDMPSDERHSREPFSVEQIGRLLRTAEPDWRTAVMLGYYMGARLGDVVALRFDNVDMEAKTIRYRQEKTGKTVECPIHTHLENYLLSLAGDDPHQALCPSLEGRETGGTNGLSRKFKQLMEKAGVADGRINPVSKGGRGFSRWSFHSLRYSFNSGLANAGVEVELRQKLSGHTNADQNQRYSKTTLEVLRGAVHRLPSIPP